MHLKGNTTVFTAVCMVSNISIVTQTGFQWKLTEWHLVWGWTEGDRGGVSIYVWPKQWPKTKQWWLLIWTSLAAKIKSQGPWLQHQSSSYWGKRQHFNKTSTAKWNPGRIVLFTPSTKSCTTVYLSICWEKFDKCQSGTASLISFILLFCPGSLNSSEWIDKCRRGN